METTATGTPWRSIDLFEKSNFANKTDTSPAAQGDKRTGKSYCFRGIPQHNNIINITVAIEIPPKTAQQTEWKLAPGSPINFDKLYPLQARPGLELYKCLIPIFYEAG